MKTRFELFCTVFYSLNELFRYLISATFRPCQFQHRLGELGIYSACTCNMKGKQREKNTFFKTGKSAFSHDHEFMIAACADLDKCGRGIPPRTPGKRGSRGMCQRNPPPRTPGKRGSREMCQRNPTTRTPGKTHTYHK